jgi:thiol-disulfide isomerase/thioredoxin
MATGLGSAIANAVVLAGVNSGANAIGNLIADSVRRRHPMQVEVTNLPAKSISPYPVILTVPHSECPDTDEEGHPCDVLAPALANAVVLPGDEILPGDKPRSMGDYVRPESAKSKWHRKLTALLRSKMFKLLVDVHSQPQGARLLGGSNVSVTYTPDRRASTMARMIVELLGERGVDARRQIAGALDRNFILTRARQEGIPAIAVDISEDAPRDAITKLGSVVNDVRRALFEPARVGPQQNPPGAHLIPIRSILYDCDGNADVGLCTTHPPGKEWYHDFERNPPLYDRQTGRVHGLAFVKADGVNDWSGSVPDWIIDNTFNSPMYRISRLKGFILADNTEVPLWGQSLWTDRTRTRLFVIGNNPSGTLGPVPLLQSEVDAVEISKKKGRVGFYFFSEQCPGCTELKPLLDRIVQQFDYLFAVDWTKFAKLGELHNVLAIPCIVVYRDGERGEMLKGKELLAWAKALPEEAPEKPVGKVVAEKSTAEKVVDNADADAKTREKIEPKQVAMLVVREKSTA